MTKEDYEKEIRQLLDIPNWIEVIPFLQMILEQAKAWQLVHHLVDKKDKSVSLILKAYNLAREIEQVREEAQKK